MSQLSKDDPTPNASVPLTNVVRIVRIKFIYVKVLQDIGLPDWFFPSEGQAKFIIDVTFKIGRC